MKYQRKALNQKRIKHGRYQVHVLKERCKGCGYCIEFCPKRMLSRSNEMNSKGYHLVNVVTDIECSGCNVCSFVCPDFAIFAASVDGESEI